MQILKTIVFPGPNRWSLSPVMEVHLETDLPHEGRAAELMSTVTELHKAAGVETSVIPPIPTSSPTIFVFAFEFEEESLLRECIESVLRLAATTPTGASIDTHSEHRRLLDLADHVRLGPSSRAILNAASARGIPYQRLNQGSLVQLGEGAFQRRIWTAETDATSAIAESIASDKQLTRSMLAAVGVNVPQGRSVADREDAWKAAQEIGLPIAVKPRQGNHAVGVSLDLGDREAVLTAYDWACEVGATTDVLVEQYIVGDHHRLLVVDGKLVAAARGQREYVIGDGVRSITELVDELNSDPRRGENYTDQLDIINLSETAAIVLNKQGLTFDSVPSHDQKVLIRHVGDLVEDCTDAVHPATRQVAILAARTIGLDIAGMDVVATDIARPLSEQRGCIIEVNAGPSLSPHVAPLIGSPQPVGEAIVDLLFADERPSKVPTILILNDPNSPAISTSLAIAMERIGFNVGIASDSRPTTGTIHRKLSEFGSLLMHPFLTAIVIDCSADHVAKAGLACSHAEFVVVPDWFFDDAAIGDAKSSIQATLQTICHLSDDHCTMIVTGKRQFDSRILSRACGIAVSRIKSLSGEEPTIAFICESLCTASNHDWQPTGLPNRATQRSPAFSKSRTSAHL